MLGTVAPKPIQNRSRVGGRDVVVVGGGAAGCGLAARLTQDPGRRVLLPGRGLKSGIATANTTTVSALTTNALAAAAGGAGFQPTPTSQPRTLE